MFIIVVVGKLQEYRSLGKSIHIWKSTIKKISENEVCRSELKWNDSGQGAGAGFHEQNNEILHHTDVERNFIRTKRSRGL